VHTFGLFDNGVSLDRLQQLEVTVFEKIRQRTYFKKDEGLKSSNVFKFLDLEGKGLLDYVGFVAVLDRIGCKFSDKECKALFYKHSQGSSALSYEALCGLFFEMGSGNKDNPNVVFELSRSQNNNITTHGMTKRLN
jgi:Ca2+-binding EF-hand superfamily protein